MTTSRLWSQVLGIVLLIGIGVLMGYFLRPPPEDEEVAATDARADRIAALETEVAQYRRRIADMHPETPILSPPERGSERRPVADRVPSEAPDAKTRGDSASSASEASPIFPPELGVLDVIRALEESRARQRDPGLVSDGEAFSVRFRAQAEGPTLRGEETEPGAAIEAGSTIVLGDGVHDFAAFSKAHRGAFPADLTFRGRGRDRTLLILHEIGATGEIRNLAFEDVTLDTRGHYLADVRGDEPISLRFDRARVIGFDPEPDGAVLLAARHGAVLARDTHFESGFGGAPGTGSFFHVRGPFLVRFERCVIRGAFRSLYEKSEKAAYAYVDCRFEAMDPARRRDLESPDPRLHIEDCVLAYRLDAEGQPPTRARSELNPEWR